MMSHKRLRTAWAATALLGALALAVPGVSSAQAADAGLGYSGAVARRINLGVGKSIIVDLPQDASEIFVADPKVANAVVRSSRKLYLIATGTGQTSVFAMDAQGRQIAALDITIGRDVGELGAILRAAMPTSSIVPRTINDTIILTGGVDSAGDAQMALDIAKGFVGRDGSAGGGDGKVVNSLTIRGRDQVMLKVTIAEVQRQVLKQLGVNTALNGNWGAVNVTNPFNLQTLSPNTAANLGNYAGVFSGSAKGFAAQVQAYERNGVARVLAEPNVTAISGESAKFTVGGEIPVPNGESCTPTAAGVNTCVVGITFKQYGVTLNFTPVVLSEGRIQLRLATEVTELDPTQIQTFNTVSVPGFRTRKNETTVELPSGGSIVSAGLIQTIGRQQINGLPGLMNLPILGALFRSRDYQREETELMIIVTPYIAKPSKPQELARPTDGFTDATDPQAVLLGRVNRIYSTVSNPQIIQNFKGRVGFIND